ncbi:MAG TPA: DNA mismatch repair endonuclease MutL [Candidatus Scatovivens faecipullorum]|nr:DNA mismatch repair endonuclease MutL [Candidatus Scatovivens faecipullorum]
MGNIVLLDDLTINKIAAGEVIERPASVVKEMLENSIDAGAKNITVEIKNGGISLIKIIDDGVGIAEDDMEIAFERHATSKIRKAEDLESIKSMGFRGEALASIAAISKVEMVSKKENDDVGHKIVVEGGKTVEFTEEARSVGTTITVRNLFYNTPVRYKFLKKDYTEAGYIEDAVTRIALVNKNVAIKLISNGKTIIQTNGNGDLKTLIYSIYGKDIATEVIELDYEYEGIKVSGVIGKPVIARANRSNQLFFLNGRYIKDKNLSAAADQAYKGMIPIGRYGFIILNLEMDPKLVDVNVHPAKLEVRFEEESKVFKAVYHAIKSSLAKSELVENVEKENSSQNDAEINENNETNIETNIDKNIDKNSNNKINVEDDLSNFSMKNSHEKKSGGIAGLFHKIIKESEETVEELSNNHLEEIFKYRQGLKNDKSSNENIREFDSNNVDNFEENNLKISENDEIEKEDILNKKIEIAKTINDNEISKKISLGNTFISSNTKELDVNNVNELIKDATTKMLSIKMAEKQPTQIVNTEEIRNEEFDKTQKIDLSSHNSIQDTVVAEENLNSLPQNTIVLNSKNEKNELSKENINNIQEKDALNNINNEKINSENDEFSKIAEKLMEARLSSDNTQMIDTGRVREALKEENFETNPEFDKMYKKTFGVDPFSVRKEKELEKLEQEKINASGDFSYPAENMNVFEEKEDYPEISYKFIGIVFSTYIIIEIKNEMYIIDQHAAHERIMYEKVKANYYSEDEKDEQLLLLPDVISLTHKEMAIAKENVEMFAKAGFTFEEFGDNTIKLVTVPGMCEELNTKQLFLDILDEIDTVAVTARQEKEDKFIATVACKAAVKAKMKLDEKEVKSLMNKLLELPNPFTCPHGRPTAIKMTKYDLEKKFSRR